jgi:SpoVA protein.
MQNLTNGAYSEMVKTVSPKTKSLGSTIAAFLCGGLVCTAAQLFKNFYRSFGIDPDTASAGTIVTMIAIAALLTGLNIFDNLAKTAGAGVLVPITGFSNAMTSSALEFKSEGYVLGLGAKIFTIAGPVIAYGLIAGVVYGAIVYMFHLY